MKSKYRLASNTPNRVLNHKNITGVQPLWKSLIAHHISNLRFRINDTSLLEYLTHLRIKQAQLQNKSTKSIFGLSKKYTSSLIDTNNFNIKVIKEARKIGFKFKSDIIESELTIIDKGTEIYELLDHKHRYSFCKENKLNLFIVEQIVEKKGIYMLTWSQIKKI